MFLFLTIRATIDCKKRAVASCISAEDPSLALLPLARELESKQRGWYNCSNVHLYVYHVDLLKNYFSRSS